MSDGQDRENGDGAPARLVAEVAPSGVRRAFALGVLVGLGALLVSTAVGPATGSPLARAVLATCGLGAVALAWLVHRATGQRLRLTTEALADGSGRILAPVSAIERVDRGAFAFKPSNGFLLHLRAPAPRHWAPGLWWRLGRRVGVGGVTAAAETRAMADAIAIMIAERNGPGPGVDPDPDR